MTAGEAGRQEQSGDKSIVTKDKVNFEGEMEVFQFKAKNNARYRIEKFILLDDIPEIPVRELKIENFRYQLRTAQFLV